MGSVDLWPIIAVFGFAGFAAYESMLAIAATTRRVSAASATTTTSNSAVLKFVPEKRLPKLASTIGI
jgi:hypothetical protein